MNAAALLQNPVLPFAIKSQMTEKSVQTPPPLCVWELCFDIFHLKKRRSAQNWCMEKVNHAAYTENCAPNVQQYLLQRGTVQ